MQKIKCILGLIAVLIAYGVVGSMDYEDVQLQEQAQADSAQPVCLYATFPAQARSQRTSGELACDRDRYVTTPTRSGDVLIH